MRAKCPKILVPAVICAALAACTTPPPAPEAPNLALPAAPPPGEPPDLAGMDAAALRVAFGTPVFVRKDGQSEMWRYDNAACKAFFFLYPKGQTLAVRHVETIPRGQDIAADAGCLAQLRLHPAVS